MDIKKKIEEIIQEVEKDHEGEMFTDLSGNGLKDFNEVIEFVMDCDNSNEFEVGFYQGVKFMGKELTNYVNKFKGKAKD